MAPKLRGPHEGLAILSRDDEDVIFFHELETQYHGRVPECWEKNLPTGIRSIQLPYEVFFG
jgi:hypothetical protein